MGQSPTSRGDWRCSWDSRGCRNRILEHAGREGEGKKGPALLPLAHQARPPSFLLGNRTLTFFSCVRVSLVALVS